MEWGDKKVTVIGGGSGIGHATARLLTKLGATAVVGGRSEGRMQAVATHLGAKARGFAVDVTDSESVKQFFEQVGPYDHLVITAAELGYAPLVEQDVGVMRATIDSKLWGHIFAARYGRVRIAEHGSMVFCSGLAAFRPGIGATVVAAANGAINSLTKGLALEFAPVRVNAVAPGVTDTPGWSHLSEEERQQFFDNVASALPVKMVGDAHDVAKAIVFLMENPFVSGTILPVDGGGRLV